MEHLLFLMQSGGGEGHGKLAFLDTEWERGGTWNACFSCAEWEWERGGGGEGWREGRGGGGEGWGRGGGELDEGKFITMFFLFASVLLLVCTTNGL